MVNGCLDFSLLCTACKKKLRDPQRHSFDFEQVLFRSMLTLLRYLHAKNEDRWTDRQTAFQLYIVVDVKMVIMALLLRCATVCYPSTEQLQYSNCTVIPSKINMLKKIRGYTSIIVVKHAKFITLVRNRCHY